MTPTTDKELLELAARAAGYRLDGPVPSYAPGHPGAMLLLNERGGHSIWNPLTDDGDALRLVVRLSMTVQVDVESKSVAAVWYGGKLAEERFTDHASAQVATRRAIVRCAALAASLLDDMRDASPGAVSRGNDA